MNKKSIIVLIIIAVLVVIGLVWAFGAERAVAPEDSTSQIDTSDWQTYRNEELGFEFKYPRGWGEIIQTTSSQLGNKKILVNINEFQRTDQQLKNLAHLQVEGEQCEFYLITSKELKNHKFASISMSQTKNRLLWEDCLTAFSTIPNERKERKVTSPHAYTIVYLDEHEVPEIMQEDYQEFKLFIDSFKVI